MIKKQTLFKALLLGTIITQTSIYAMRAEDTLQTEASIENAHKQAYTLLNSVLTDLEKESITTLPTFEDINKRLKEITTITKNVVSPDDFHQYSFLNNALRSLLTKRFTEYNDAIKHFDNLRRSQKRPGTQEIRKRLQVFATNYISLVETGRLKEQKTAVIPTIVPAITTQAFNTTQRATITAPQPISTVLSTPQSKIKGNEKIKSSVSKPIMQKEASDLLVETDHLRLKTPATTKINSPLRLSPPETSYIPIRSEQVERGPEISRRNCILGCASICLILTTVVALPVFIGYKSGLKEALPTNIFDRWFPSLKKAILSSNASFSASLNFSDFERNSDIFSLINALYFFGFAHGVQNS